MKRLVVFELRKIMVRRVWISIAACLAITIFFFVDTAPAPGMNSILAVNKERPELIAAHEGPIQVALAKKYEPSLKMERAEDSVGSKEQKIERILQQNYAVAAYQADLFKNRLNDLSAQKAQLESQGEKESYTYKNINKKLTMMERIDPPGFYVTEDWKKLFGFIAVLSSPSIMFIGLVIVLALAPLYSGEAGYRMDSLILSSKYGRRSIVTAKLIAGLIFTVGWVTAFYGVCVIVSCLPYGFVGWDAPLNSSYLFGESPYAMTQLQGLFLQYAIAIMGACGLLLWTALISAAFRSSLSSFGLAMTLVILPFISLPGIIGEIISLLPSSIMASGNLIESYRTYNLFNTPILYIPLSIVVTAILAILTLLLIPKAFGQRLKV
jgi:ABC-type transport system involved in multi-copper enzyme maturation permease subunit